MPERLGVIGLGFMGRPIAENYLKKGYPVTIYDIRESVLKDMEALGATVARSPLEVAKQSRFIFIVVPDEKTVKKLLWSKEGLAKGTAKSSVIIDMTTSDPSSSQKNEKKLASLGIDHLDSPMTGGAIGARNGQLLLMVGGKKEVFQRCEALFAAISKGAIYMGPAGSGHLMKLIHNQLSHSTFLASCEAVALGEKLGLNREMMIRVFNEGNARSYATEVRFPKFILPETYNIGATFATVYKDISIVKRVGNRARMKLPMNDCTYKYWKYPIDRGEGQEDFTKIVLKMREILSKK